MALPRGSSVLLRYWCSYTRSAKGRTASWAAMPETESPRLRGCAGGAMKLAPDSGADAPLPRIASCAHGVDADDGAHDEPTIVGPRRGRDGDASCEGHRATPSGKWCCRVHTRNDRRLRQEVMDTTTARRARPARPRV